MNQERLFKVLLGPHITEKSAMASGDAAQVVMRNGIDLAISDSHSDFFVKNQLAIRATMRVGFPVYRQAAFHKITAF